MHSQEVEEVVEIVEKEEEVEEEEVKEVKEEKEEEVDRLFDTIVGQNPAKLALLEMVIQPALRPELFTGFNAPPKGLLFYGPPGNGKTMLANALTAHKSQPEVFKINVAMLPYMSERYVVASIRDSFNSARQSMQPSVVFIDDLDHFFCKNAKERISLIRCELLLQLEKLQSETEDWVLVIATTNKPHYIGQVALRYFPQQVYVGLPDACCRLVHLRKLFYRHNYYTSLPDCDLDNLVQRTDGYSYRDLSALARYAAMEPIRELSLEQLQALPAHNIRNITLDDFNKAMLKIPKYELSAESLEMYATCAANQRV